MLLLKSCGPPYVTSELYTTAIELWTTLHHVTLQNFILLLRVMDHLTSGNCSKLYTFAKELWTTLHHVTVQYFVLLLKSYGPPYIR